MFVKLNAQTGITEDTVKSYPLSTLQDANSHLRSIAIVVEVPKLRSLRPDIPLAVEEYEV